MTRREPSGWSGGQYSLVRALIGAYLAAHFAMLVPYGPELFSARGVLPDSGASPLARAFPNVLATCDDPWTVTAILVGAVIASSLLAVGCRDRLAALALAYVSACLHARNPLIANPSLPYVGWILVAHACLPPAPYGSWSARGRSDPRGSWSFPRDVRVAAWVALAAGTSYSGLTKLASPSWLDGSAIERILANPLARPGWLREVLLRAPPELLAGATYGVLGLEVLFLPLALLRRVRPWIWASMAGLHVALIALIDFADLSLGMLAIHLFTFDPSWVPARGAGTTVRVYFDEDCASCRRWVRFALAEAPIPEAFRFAPLNGRAFFERVPEELRAPLPDSLVVEDGAGRLAVRSDAVLRVLERCGGLWRVLAAAARLAPAALRDRAYDILARSRRSALAPRVARCPIAHGELQVRVDPRGGGDPRP